ncbi:UNVERIFIED_CONTAM: Geranylgeranyl diphosphate reductase, chloroplastic [Sesamum latifolium]|uniref:Geranylgeranyl diphosphate reductase, chloroplastic n=1 Tax=Sesamum latifolium TaxID=2727402 RepID=A0AAW2UJV3_9LAMI
MVDESDLRCIWESGTRRIGNVQGFGYPAESFLPVESGEGGVRGDVRRRVCAEDDLRQLFVQAGRARNPLDDLKLAVNTIGSLVRANALRKEMEKLSV